MGGGSGGGAAQVQYEPVKTAEESVKSASSATARAQEMRRGITSTFNRRGITSTFNLRGITSTFNRRGMTSSSSAGGATAGTAARLGG